MVQPISERSNLADDYERITTGDLKSPAYRRLINSAVARTFYRMQTEPEPNWCDSDIEDVSQEVICNLIVFFRKRDCRKDDASDVTKHRYLIHVAFRFAKFGVIAFYQMRSFGRKVTPNIKFRVPIIHYWEMDSMNMIPQPRAMPCHHWERFVSEVELKLCDKKAAVAIAVASAKNAKDASRNLGIKYATLYKHLIQFRTLLRNDPNDLLGGLGPRVCRICGVRIGHREQHSMYCSSRCSSRAQKRKAKEARLKEAA